MIVVDASALLELLLATRRAEAVGARALAAGETLHAPHLLDVEIAQALRRLVQLRELSVARAEHALHDFADFMIERHAHGALLSRMWQLRESVSAYDAAYLALAEALEAPLLTCDGKLARSHGLAAEVQLIS